MKGFSEKLSAAYHDWDARGRGYQVWESPVHPEPLFTPFLGPRLSVSSSDDGRKPTFLSSWLQRVSERLAPPSPETTAEDTKARTPRPFERTAIVELTASLPAELRFDVSAYVGLFGSLRSAREPLAFEVIGASQRVTVQIAMHPDDERLVRRQISSFVPEVTFVNTTGFLEREWGACDPTNSAVLEFGLGKDLATPFANLRNEPYLGLCGALSEVHAGEVLVFQVVFAPTDSDWQDGIVRAVSQTDGSALFVNAPELLPGARQKTEFPLYAAVVRLGARGGSNERIWELLCDAGAALGGYGSSRGNELIPLRNDEYPPEAHAVDLVKRQSRRSGMLLNGAELAAFVHFPSADVRGEKIRPKVRKTKAAPATVTTPAGLMLGTNLHEGVEKVVRLSRDQRARHIHIIGASGTGKSTLLCQMIQQDIEAGEGVTVLDPHGDLIDRILGAIPKKRVSDVVLLDPADEERIVGFNILSAETDWERNLLASDLVSVFRRLSTSWGDQLNSVLYNAILAFLKRPGGGTLVDLRRFLLEPKFRNEVLATVSDPNVTYYWKKAFPQLTGNKSVGSVITRLDTFLSPEAIRYMVAQRECRLDFRNVMESGKIFLAKLSHGIIGPENAHLLGSLIVAKLQSLAMARQRQSESTRKYHWVYIDEFHDFLTSSLAGSLTGVRKYRVGFVLGHQEMRQVEKEPDVASALLSNAGTRIVFRVGDRDARTMEAGFTSFDARDLQSLANFEAFCRIERVDQDFSLSISRPSALPPGEEAATRREVIDASRTRYGVSRAELEAALYAALSGSDDEPPPSTPGAAVAKPPASPVEPSASLAAPASPAVAPAAAISGVHAPEGGRGGAQHTAVQRRLKAAAEALGFRATVEKTILNGAGCVDLVVERAGVAIACEITITTTIDHEVGNVEKCVKAGFAEVAVISISATKLSQLKAAVVGSLGEKLPTVVRYFQPDEFVAYLKAFPVPPLPVESDTTVFNGIKVKKKFPKFAAIENKAREDAAIKAVADAMLKNKQKP